jgi:hypothetical protein
MMGTIAKSNFARLNRISGWVVGIIACTVFILTMEPTGSFWDCGEFITSCNRLEIPHPPGAPLFILMGRFFIILFGDNPLTAARAVNCMSALASGLSILFLFWTITHFAKKLVTNTEPDRQQTITILSAGAIGALAYTFCDSFWYSAVEGEVYASSAFFTAIVFWAVLKWEQDQTNGKAGADRWLIFIFYMMGLSIGVHLLNLLTIPAIVLVFYFNRYRPTLWGTITAFLIGCAITGFVQVFVIQYTVKSAGALDVFFVNSLGLPFFSGFTTFFVLLAAAMTYGILWAARRNKYYLKTGLWSAAFMLLGYSTYITTMIRSNADTPVDMYNIDNPIALAGYLGRETYGDWPILYGPDFSDPVPFEEKGNLYEKGRDHYDVAGKKYAQDWAHAPNAHFFPRMYSSDNTRGDVDTYKRFSGMADGDNPTMADNIKYFLSYQTNWMYLRYFMWNFAGKQNDVQGYGNPRDSNWVSGIGFVDNLLYGDQSKMPDSIHKNNKAYNRLYMLPLFLGLLGLFVQYRRNRRDAIVTGLLFFFTGWAIVFYLNQAGLQPRERDYAFAGSFYVFAIWIGLGVIGIQQLITKYWPRLPRPAAAWSAAALCLLAVPVLMASQEWDDHDRSKKTLARDIAVDYLESCPPNAILFSFADNDTYPIWYAQEVERVRPDVRVIINTLSGTDWLINSLRYKINNAAPVDPLFSPEQIAGDKKSIAYFTDRDPGFNKDKYYDLYDTFKTVLANDDPRYMAASESGMPLNLLPTRKFSVPVDSRLAIANGAAHPGEPIAPQLDLDISPQKNFLLKNELTMLAIIAANRWHRPICFTTPSEINALGLGKYVRNRGLAYELTPVENSRVDNDVAYNQIMTKFQYGHAGTPGVYFDGDNRRELNMIKLTHAEIANSLAAAGRKEDARRVLENYDRNVDIKNFPYGLTSNSGNLDNSWSLYFLQTCYAADDPTLAAKVAASIKKDLNQQMQYYQSRGEYMTDDQLAMNAQQALQGKQNNLSDKQVEFAQDILSTYQILLQIDQGEHQYKASLTKPSM